MAASQQIHTWLHSIFHFNEKSIHTLQKFAAFVQDWNQKINLVSRKDVAFLWEHHILPSLLVLTVTQFEPGEQVLDIGSGGGFPAIPLKIAQPDLQIIMVESIRKKAQVLEQAVEHLQLNQITVVNDRVEALHDNPVFRQQFHTITARAVADVATLYRWAKPLLRSEGRLLLWKGERDVSDLEQAQRQLGFTARVLRLPEALAREHPRWASTRWFEIRG